MYWFLLWLSVSQLLMAVLIVRHVRLPHRQGWHRHKQLFERLRALEQGVSEHHHPLYEPTPLPLPGSIDLAPLWLELNHMNQSLRDHLYPDPPPSTTPLLTSPPPTPTIHERIMAKIAKRLVKK